ncbi:MAG: signal peptide peptidase SppA [Pirellulales bacterium]
MSDHTAAESSNTVLAQPRSWDRWRGRLAWIITGISVVVAAVALGANAEYFQTNPKVIEQYHSMANKATNKIAIVEIRGAIMGGEGFARHQLDQVKADESVRAIVLRIDSPGGTVSGSDELHYRLKKLAAERNLPVVVSMGSIAASGGYYVAMANGGEDDIIFAEPSTITGSIGVIIPHFDFSQLLKRFDVTDDSITSGPLKEMLSVTKSRSTELAKKERGIVQDLVDEMFTRFKDIVRKGRPKLDDKTIEAVTTGQVFTANQAITFGLIDKIGFLEDAIARAVILADLQEDSVRVIQYKKPQGLFDELLGGASQARSFNNLEMLVEWTTPRAWYLCSWWPVITTSYP